MSDGGKDQDAGKNRLSLRPAGRLEVGRTVDAGSVRQSFSHGRSKVVQVEVRKKRAGVAPAAPSSTPGGGAPRPGGGRPPAGPMRALTATELATRQRVLEEQQKDNARREAERREQEKISILSAAEEARRREEEARRAAEAEEEARHAAEADAASRRTEEPAADAPAQVSEGAAPAMRPAADRGASAPARAGTDRAGTDRAGSDRAGSAAIPAAQRALDRPSNSASRRRKTSFSESCCKAI